MSTAPATPTPIPTRTGPPASATPHAGRTAPDPVILAVAFESGPAVQRPVPLAAGRHVIGRAADAAITISDPGVEPHHVALDVAADGRLSVLQLTGRTPVLLDGRPLAARTTLGAGATLDLGATRLRLLTPRPPAHGAIPGPHGPSLRGPDPDGWDPDGWDPDGWNPDGEPDGPDPVGPRLVVRSPRAVPFLALPAVEPPPPYRPPSATGGHPGMLMGSLVGVLAGVTMAVMTGSPVALVLGSIAALVALATWTVARVRAARDVRREHRRHTAAVGEVITRIGDAARRIRLHHEASVPTPGTLLAAVDGAAHDLWCRRTAHGDAFTVSLGRGDVDRPVPIRGDHADRADDPLPHEVAAALEAHRTLTDVEVPARLDTAPQWVVAVEGAGAPAVVRSIVAQLAVTTGPADWRLRAVVTDPDTHRWMARLPHADADGDGASIVAAEDAAAVAAMTTALDDGDDRRIVVVCDAPSQLATRTAPLRRLLDGDRPVTVVLAVTDGSGLPAVCGATLRLGECGTARWHPDLHDPSSTSTWGTVRVRPTGLAPATAHELADRLVGVADPEDPTWAVGRLPRTLRVDELAGVPLTPDAVREAWRLGGNDPAPLAVLGASADGAIEIDLVRDGPHGLVAGTTGSGKSELLRTWVATLAARCDPRHLALVLVDYKGGSTFDACARLPHVVGVVTDLDEGLAARALVSLEAELRRRERILRDHGAADIAAHRARPGADPLPRLVVVVDEFAALAVEIPDFLASLVGIAQRGRSLGIHLLLATQRPAGVVDDAIRANTNLRLALRLHDASDAVDVVGDRGPATFPRGIPGRAMVRLGPGELVEFQGASCTVPSTVDGDGEATVLDALVAAVRAAADRSGFTGSHRPWLPPLGDLGDHGDLTALDDDELAALVTGGGDPSTATNAATIGVVDDPGRQARRALRWDDGNLALVGGRGAGTTTTLVTLARAADERGDVIDVIDGRGDTALTVVGDAARCRGVVAVDDRERIDRLLRRLADVIDTSKGDAGVGAPVAGRHVLLVDGLETLHRALDETAGPDATGDPESWRRFLRILGEGPAAGVTVAAAVDPAAAPLGSLLPRFAERWVFHVADPAAAAATGVPPGRVPAGVPGRLVVASSGLDAQVRPARPRPVAAEDERPVEPIAVLAPLVPADTVPPVDGAALVVGRRFDDLQPARLDLVNGDRLLVAGPRGSGRSTTLARLMASWRSAWPDTAFVVVCGSPMSPLVAHPGRCRSDQVADVIAGILAEDRPCVVVVDDADRVDDRSGALARSLGEPDAAGVGWWLAGRAEGLRAYDHWGAAVRRNRLGFVLTTTPETDADVLGVAPPRRCPLPPRPGLAWMVHHGECDLVQVAQP